MKQQEGAFGRDKKTPEKKLKRNTAWKRKNAATVKVGNKRWRDLNREKANAAVREWRRTYPERAKKNQQEANCKWGKRYKRTREYNSIGLRGARNRIRVRDANHYRAYKQIIAPESQIHHEWIPKTPNYRGAALVEKAQHQHGYIDVIQILEGEIILFAEHLGRR